jgi:hypothetical protein
MSVSGISPSVGQESTVTGQGVDNPPQEFDYTEFAKNTDI